MHIHGNSMNVNSASFYSVGNGEKSAAAERAADVRKRLLKARLRSMAQQAPRKHS